MKKFHLRPTAHIRITRFREEVILLDLKLDKYYIIPQKTSDLFCRIMTEGVQENLNYYSLISDEKIDDSFVLNELVHELLLSKMIETIPFHLPFNCSIPTNGGCTGVENVDWRLPLSGVKISKASRTIIYCYLTLFRIHWCLKLSGGFYKLIRLLQRTKFKKPLYTTPTHQELSGLADCLNKACMLFPKRVKCLEWAVTFVLLSIERGWKSNLVVGIQNYPFLSHAWVEFNDQVLFDQKELSTQLAIILTEPFCSIAETSPVEF